MRAIAAAMLMVFCGSGLALAQTRPPSTLEQQADETARAMRETVERAMRMFDGVLGSIPQYEAPEVLPNGDIILRRIPQAQQTPPSTRPPQRAPAPPPAPKKTPADPKLEET